LTTYLARTGARLRLYGCEAFNFPTYARFDHARSATIADGLVLDVPHPEVQARIAGADVALHLVADAAIQQAMRDLYTTHALVVEPSSAVTIAFIKDHIAELEEPVCVVLTGANITLEDFHRLITG
jgi:threonine dehydratase